MRSALRTFLAALAIVIVLPSQWAAALEVFANTGPGNTGPNISGPTPTIYTLAQGFVTGSTSYQLQSVQMVFNFTDPNELPVPLTANQYLRIDLYNSTGQVVNSSTPTGSSIASFSSTPVEGFTYNQQTKYTFNVTGTQSLAANTAYWVVVSAQRYTEPPGVVNPSFNWGFAEGSVSPPVDPSADKPVARNGSGYSYLGTFGQQTLSGPWVNYNVSGNMASGVRIGVIVVPEPSTYALGVAGVLALGAIGRRKSRKTAKA